MITPSFGLTATERVLPKLALDFTTASLDSRITFTRTGGTATVVDSNGLVSDVSADTPRFDYDPITLTCKGLLIEETRTNLVTYSQDFSQWNGVNNTTVNTDVASAPNNLNEADEIVGAVTSGGNQIVRTVTGLTTSTNYVLSIFFKPVVGGYDCIRLGLTGFDGITRQATINVDTGALVSSANATLLNVETFANGFKRFSVSVTSGSGVGTTSFRIYGAGATGNPFGSLPGQKVIIWGAQLEAGAFATSYIPTTTAQVTRTADVATMTETDFSDWFNASEGTFVANTLTPAGTGNQYSFSVQNAAFSSFIIMYRGPTTVSTAMNNTGVNQASTTLGAYANNTPMTCSLAYKDNDYAAALNAGTPLTDNICTVPTLDRFVIGNRESADRALNSHVQSIYYYDLRLTNVEVQTLSKV